MLEHLQVLPHSSLVDWAFMFQTLEHFQLGQDFIKWVCLVYTDISSIIKANGMLSDSFTLERGVRQGCPLSAFLYIITAEVLSLATRANPDITGIRVVNTESNLSQYVDDSTLTLTDIQSLRALNNTLNTYEQASGAKLHAGKRPLARIKPGTVRSTQQLLLVQS